MVLTVTDSNRVEQIDRQRAALAALVQARAAGRAAAIVAAEQEVVRVHLSVAAALARRYRNREVDQDDLVQVAALGLVKAARRWDAGRESAFLAYAVPTMVGEMKRYFRDHTTMIRAPRELNTLHVEVNGATEELVQRLGRHPRDQELAAAAGVTVELIRAQQLSYQGCRTQSLDVPWIQAVAAQQCDEQSEAQLTQVNDAVAVQAVMAQLGDRDRRILELRFFQELTQTEIAAAVGVSQMQISRILARVLQDLRRQLADAGRSGAAAADRAA